MSATISSQVQRWGCVCSLLVCMWCAPSLAFAQQDYAPDVRDWNGLSELQLVAQSEGIELVFEDRLELDALSLEEPLLIIYPEQELRANALTRYIIDGGRVVLADDFGQSSSLLSRLDIDRQMPARGALPHQEFFQNNPALPVFRAQGLHPLLSQVDVVIANHPAVLSNVGGPVLKYSEDGGLVYDMNLGKGKALVLGDASLLINHMLGVADNETLVRNSLRYVCEVSAESTCVVHVYAGQFTQSGSYGSEDTLLGDQEAVSEKIQSLNQSIHDLMEQIPAARLFYYLGVLIAFGLVAYLGAIFPLRKTRAYSFFVQDTLKSIHNPQGEFDWNLARYANASGATNYALPISILKEIVEELILKKMGLWDRKKSENIKVADIAQRFGQEYLKNYPVDMQRKLEKKFATLLATFASVPTRQRIFLDSDTFFNERDMLSLYEDSMEILEIMELKENYERRIRLYI